MPSLHAGFTLNWLLMSMFRPSMSSTMKKLDAPNDITIDIVVMEQ